MPENRHMLIRRADPTRDAQACTDIYAHHVLTGHATFEIEPPDVAEMTRRIEARLASHDWLVAEDDKGTVVGFAYAAPYRERAAYDWAVETTIYLAPDAVGRGTGRALYTELLNRMRNAGIHTATALIALPNDASEALHRAFGYEPVGTFKEIGFKHSVWRDIRWYQVMLGSRD